MSFVMPSSRCKIEISLRSESVSMIPSEQEKPTAKSSRSLGSRHHRMSIPIIAKCYGRLLGDADQPPLFIEIPDLADCIQSKRSRGDRKIISKRRVHGAVRIHTVKASTPALVPS